MAEFQESKAKSVNITPAQNGNRIPTAGRVVYDAPEIITKKWICWRFNIPTNQGATCRRLRKLVFDDRLLSLLELSEKEWKCRREFNRRETIIIMQYLQI